MPSSATITDLVDQIQRSVVARTAQRTMLAREIEGDLREAVAARVVAGQDEREATAAVVAEFGEPRAIAAELSIELLAARGRRFAAFAGVGVAVLLAAWFVGMTTLVGVPGFRLSADDGWMLQVSKALDVAGPLVVAVAIAGWLVIRRFGSLAALAALAALQLVFALTLVVGAIAMVGALTVPAAGTSVLVALVGVTLLLGSGLVASSVAVLLRWGAVRLEPLRARS